MRGGRPCRGGHVFVHRHVMPPAPSRLHPVLLLLHNRGHRQNVQHRWTAEDPVNLHRANIHHRPLLPAHVLRLRGQHCGIFLQPGCANFAHPAVQPLPPDGQPHHLLLQDAGHQEEAAQEAESEQGRDGSKALTLSSRGHSHPSAP